MSQAHVHLIRIHSQEEVSEEREPPSERWLQRSVRRCGTLMNDRRSHHERPTDRRGAERGSIETEACRQCVTRSGWPVPTRC